MTTRSSKEAGLAEFQASPWWTLFAPEGTPRPILDKITDALIEKWGKVVRANINAE
jgi:hypothetical protein